LEAQMVKVFYWQWGKRVEHDEQFDDVDEAVAFLFANGVPQRANQVVDFAPDEIVDGARVIRGPDLDRLLSEYERR
jgi:hypothetical protein